MWPSVADGGSCVEMDKESCIWQRGSGNPLPRIAVERIPEVESRRFYVLFLDIEALGRKEKELE